MAQTPFEIMFGTQLLIIPNLQTDLLAELDDRDLLDATQGVQWAHKHVRPKLRALYESGVPPEPTGSGQGTGSMLEGIARAQVEGTFRHPADDTHCH